MEKQKVKAVVFDFDGVLAESVNVKGEAFYALYEHEGPDIQQKVLEYHLAHGGVSRYEKIRHYEEKLLNRSVTDQNIDDLANRFSVLVEEKVAQSEWVDGAKDFLEEFHQKILLFVASATPQKELDRIIVKRGMDQYFHAVFGTPTKKARHLKAIMDEYGLSDQQIVMIGDTMSDYNAAQEAKTQFIGRVAPGLNSPFPQGTVEIPNLVNLEEKISF